MLDAVGGPSAQRVVTFLSDRPFVDLTIWAVPESDRQPSDPVVARNYTTQAFFGPTAQSAPILRLDDEIFMILDPGDAGRVWSTNQPTSNPQQRGTINQVHGFPISVQIVNSDVFPLVITVEFLAMAIVQG